MRNFNSFILIYSMCVPPLSDEDFSDFHTWQWLAFFDEGGKLSSPSEREKFELIAHTSCHVGR